ncbi:MAG: hypothetical protein HRU11_04355 [Parvularculaceae bacterium]|nr:hypothetical protein [Parvularculaceae bacterium]
MACNQIIRLAALTTLGLAAACSSGPEAGAPRDLLPKIVSQPQGLLFAGMDSNHDGETSRAEVRAAAPLIFARVDTDNSGAVRAIELQEFAATYLGTRDTPIGVEQFDRNADRQVNEDEMLGYLFRLFDKADENDDDTLQRSEFVDTIQPGVRNGRGQGPQGSPGGQRGQRRR